MTDDERQYQGLLIAVLTRRQYWQNLANRHLILGCFLMIMGKIGFDYGTFLYWFGGGLGLVSLTLSIIYWERAHKQ